MGSRERTLVSIAAKVFTLLLEGLSLKVLF